MDNSYIGIFKVNQTMYFDFNDDYWRKDKPEGKYKEDYTLMRKGTMLTACELDEKEYFDGIGCSVECSNNKYTVYFENLDNLHDCDWLDVIEDWSEEE